MSRYNEPFHPVTISEETGAGAVFIGTDPEARGITQRLWVGAQVLASMLHQVESIDLPLLVDRAERWASAADALATALIDQQQQQPGTLTPELLLQAMEVQERRRARHQAEAEVRARQDAAEKEGGPQP